MITGITHIASISKSDTGVVEQLIISIIVIT